MARTSRAGVVLVAGLVLALVAGCRSSSSDKAGGQQAQKPRILTMADGGNPEELEAFAAEVSRLSGRTIRIEFKSNWRQGQRRERYGNAQGEAGRQRVSGTPAQRHETPKEAADPERGDEQAPDGRPTEMVPRDHGTEYEDRRHTDIGDAEGDDRGKQPSPRRDLMPTSGQLRQEAAARCGPHLVR